MYYTVYQIVDKITGKIYIGKHQTKNLNDGYMGSGKILTLAQKKHGIENFEKKILFVFTSEEEMTTKEAELVSEEFCARDDTYNICPGGKGGWGYVNSNHLGGFHTGEASKIGNIKRAEKMANTEYKAEYSTKMSQAVKNSEAHKEAIDRLKASGVFAHGTKHTEETKRKMSESRKGRIPWNKGKTKFCAV